MLEIPLITNSSKNTWGITEKSEEKIELLSIPNHEEDDARLIFCARMINAEAVIAAKDTDMFLLLIYVLGQLECFFTS